MVFWSHYEEDRGGLLFCFAAVAPPAEREDDMHFSATGNASESEVKPDSET